MAKVRFIVAKADSPQQSSADVVIVLKATTDCEADGAICTEDDRKLSGGLELTVNGPGQ